MNPRPFVTVPLFAVIFSAFQAAAHPIIIKTVKPSPMVIGYFDTQAQKLLKLEDAPLDDLSHIVLTNAVNVDNTGRLHVRPKDAEQGDGIVELAQKVRDRSGPSLVVSLRGFPDDVALDEISENDDIRQHFVQNIARHLVDWGADGLEIEWHADDVAGGKSVTAPFDDMERLHLAMLCQDLHGALQPLGRTLSVAVRHGRKEFESADIVDQFLDWLSLRAYSMRSIGDPHHSSMYDAEAALGEWQARGFKPSQLVLGTPFFARPGAALRKYNHDAALRQPWHELVENFQLPAGATEWGDVFTEPVHGRKWWASGFNTTRAKVHKVLDGGFGGIAFRDLHHDHKEHSLLSLAVETMQKRHDREVEEMMKTQPTHEAPVEFPAGGLSLMQSKMSLSRHRLEM